MNDLLSSSITGIISGFISSMLFFFMINWMRPKLTISPEICKESDSVGTFYGFKILNHSCYNVSDLRVEVILKTPFNSNGGANHKMQWIKLNRDHIMSFSRYKKKDTQGQYALIVATRDDLDSLWNTDNQFLEIKVHGKHSLSGISKSFEQKYYTKRNSIKDGIFNFGKTFVIS